jgi:heme exporter protein D
MDLGSHAAFIVIAYGLATLIVGSMIAWIVVDHRRQLRSLADLEARGVTRRSERTANISGQGQAPARSGLESGLPSEHTISPP